MAADVNALLGQLKKDSVFIWGHSDGAIVGLLLAMDYPVKVKKVLASGCNIQPDSLAVFPWAIAKSEEIVRQNTEENAVKLNKLMLEHPRIPYSKLSDIRAPVLLLAGDRDVIRPEHTLKIFQGIPNSQLCIIPGATHAAAWEKKELFMMIMDEFFNKPFIMPQTKAVSN
jgi:pimeloyl-ACP methyl ester carboxylesterase